MKKRFFLRIIAFFSLFIIAYSYMLESMFSYQDILGNNINSKEIQSEVLSEFKIKKASKDSISQLIEDLDNSNWFVKNSAAEAIINSKPTEISDIDKMLTLVDAGDDFKSAVALEVSSNIDLSIIHSRIIHAKDKFVKAGAIKTLGKIHSEKSIPYLTKALYGRDSYISFRASSALGRIGSTEATSILISFIKYQINNKKNKLLVGENIRDLRYSKSSKAISFLSLLLHEDHDTHTAQATDALIRIGTEEAVDEVLTALRQRSQHYSFNSCKKDERGRGTICSDLDTSILRKMIMSLGSASREHETVSTALHIVTNLDENNIVPKLLFQAIKNGDVSLRNQVIHLLGELDRVNEINMTSIIKNSLTDSEIVLALSEYSLDFQILQFADYPYPLNFPAFVINLPREVGPQFVPVLTESLKNNLTSRVDVITALGCIGSEKAVPALVSILQEHNESTSSAALLALARIGSESAIPSIIKVLQEKNLYYSDFAAYALEQIDSKIVIPELITRLNNILEKPDRVTTDMIFTIHALGHFKAKESIPTLELFLKNDNFIVREIVVHALGEIASKRAINTLTSSLQDENWYVRLAASNALKKIGVDSVPFITQLLNRNNCISSTSKKILIAEELDICRNAFFVLGKFESLSNESTNFLKMVLSDKNMNIELRRMAAISLERHGHKRRKFFKHNNLTNSLEHYCSYVQDGSLSRDMYIYSSKCVSTFGKRIGTGGGLTEIYRTLKKILRV